MDEPGSKQFASFALGARVALLILLLAVVAVGIAACLHHPGATQQPKPALVASAPLSPDLLLGNPSSATPDPANRENYLMVKPFFALSYNDSKATPNWVSWRLRRENLGQAARSPFFLPDETLPPGFYRVTHRDYSSSGFDRGHMCPHSDRAATAEMSAATFALTNIIPQSNKVNTGAWADFEKYCRDLIRSRGTLYLISGPAGRGGFGGKGPAETIARGRITVPAECWKIVVHVPQDAPDDLAAITSETRVIALVMPNSDDAPSRSWTSCRVTPAEIERKTGYRFFDRLPAAVGEALRQKLDKGPTR